MPHPCLSASSIFLAAVRQPAFLYDLDGRIAEANDLAEALAGRPLAGRSLAAVVGVFDARSLNGVPLLAAEMPVARALRGEEVVDVPIAVTAAGGRRVHVLASASPLRDGTEIIGALVIWQDVSALETDRAVAETAAEVLRVQEEVLRQQGDELVQASIENDRQRRLLDAILATVPYRVSLWDRDGRIVWANERFAAERGAPREALVGRSWRELGDPPGLVEPLAREALQAALAGATVAREVEVPGPDGPAWMAHTFLPFGRDALLVITEEITERKRADETLRRRLEELETLMETVPVAIWIAQDPACREITGNRTANEFYEAREGENVSAGPPPGEPVPQRRFFSGGRELAAEELPMQYAAAHGVEVRNAELEVLLPSGRRFVMLGSASPLREASGAVRGCLGAFLDITERKRAEEDLRRSNEDLERFAYVASHDLQEPLRSVVSFSQLLERRYRGQLGNDADEYIEFIVEGGTRMQGLILDLLAFSRVNTTRQQIAQTDAEDVLAEAVRTLDVSLREVGATLTHDPMPVVMADPLQLAQVFANLVSNAIKFRRPEVPLRIHVGARRLGDFWEFSVRDNGIGIAPEYFDKIFVIFQRLHTKETYPGTGIGLAIVKRIIDRHGGRIRVESAPGEGSTFSFTLPAA